MININPQLPPAFASRPARVNRRRKPAPPPPVSPTAPFRVGSHPTVEAYLSALQAPPSGSYASLTERLERDPKMQGVAERLYGEMEKRILRGQVTGAADLRNQVFRRAALGPELELAFSRLWARQAARGLELGVNHNWDPRWSPGYQQAHPDSDLRAAGDEFVGTVTGAMQSVVARRFGRIRVEQEAWNIPPAEVCREYQRWRGGGQFPHGRRPRDFDPNVDPSQLVYLELILRQQEVVGDLKVDLVLALGPYQEALDSVTPGPYHPGDSAERFCDELAGKALFLASGLGAGSVELHNEPNLDQNNWGGDYWNPDPENPRSITNSARRYAYAAGRVYQALKAELPELEVNLASMACTNSIDAPFDPQDLTRPGDHERLRRRFGLPPGDPDQLEEAATRRRSDELRPGHPELPEADLQALAYADVLDVLGVGRQIDRSRLDALFPVATPADDKATFAGVYRALRQHEAENDNSASLAAWDDAYAAYHQAMKLGQPAYDPTWHANDGVMFLTTVHQAQGEFFGVTQILTDRTNLHFYGTPQMNEAMLRAYGQLLARGALPGAACLTEFGSRAVDAGRQAADLYRQQGDLAVLLRAHGFSLTAADVFCFHEFEGWGMGQNGHYEPATARTPRRDPGR